MRDEGLDVELELMFPVTDAAVALRDGEIDFLAGAAHAPLYADPGWSDVRLLAALARNMYWFLVVRSDLDVERGALSSLRNVRIGAAPGPDLGLRHLFQVEGVDTEAAGITIAPVPGTDAASISFGVTAAQALEEGRIDAFWANGMGTEVAVRKGIGRVVLDARRDGGRGTLFTFPALMAARRTIDGSPDAAAAAVRGVMRAQRKLRADLGLATKVGRALFPDMEAELIAGLIERDLAYYDPAITPEMAAGLAGFGRDSGLTDHDLGYDQLVSGDARRLWAGE